MNRLSVELRRKLSLIILSLVLILSTLACNLISRVTDPVGQVIDEAQQIVTQVNIEEIEEAVEAIATSVPFDTEGLQETLAAVPENLQGGELPEDIPIPPDAVENLNVTANLISFASQIPFEELRDFYKTEMPNQGWVESNTANLETTIAAVLNYDKDARSAVVTISANPLDGQTMVLITLTE